MPSRKKAKGKARKAAKEAKEAEAKEESEAVAEVAAGQRQEGSVEAQMQQLQINAASPKTCMHGPPPGEENICEDFIKAFIASLYSVDKVGKGFVTAYNATKDEYADVYSSKLDTVISILLASGTLYILGGDNRQAQLHAMLASHFEEYMAVNVHMTKAFFSWSKVVELESADDHSLVSYYRKRIPCSCLDEKYKEVKSVKKTGLCYNPNCSLPDNGRVKRSKLLCCTRCRVANYCSVECQKGHWKEHRVECEAFVKQKAAFDSNQTKLLVVKKWSSNVARLLMQWLLIAIWAKVLGVEADADAVVCFVSIHGFSSPIIFLPFESFICSM